MLRPRIYITITGSAPGSAPLSFDFANSVTTQEGYEHLTDTAKITVPRKITMNGKNLFFGRDAVFKRRDLVKIEAGYHPNRYTIFEGFISKVGPNIPVVLDCEDYMLLLKETSITYPSDDTAPGSSENVSLKELVNVLITGTGLRVSNDIPDYKLGQISYSGKSPAQILDDLRVKFNFYSYCVGKELYVGLEPEKKAGGNKAEFKMEEVVINSDTLSVQNADNIKKKIKIISTLPTNKTVIATAGDDDGEEETYYYYGISEQATLDKIAKARLKQVKYNGLKGSIETFGEPALKHGDQATLSSTKLPERNGTYIVKSVKRSFTIKGGYRQTLELGEKVG